ncbi:MAG: hypothetical protein QM784_07175 [Polyangiaceae bacterium]
MATLHEDRDGQRRVIVKGAPEVVLQRCDKLGDRCLDVAEVHGVVDRLASRGMRVLAIAREMRVWFARGFGAIRGGARARTTWARSDDRSTAQGGDRCNRCLSRRRYHGEDDYR